MSYLIHIDEAYRDEFLKIIESFKQIGLVKGYQENDTTKDVVLNDDELKNMVETARQQMEAEEGLTTYEAKQKIKTWRKK